MDYGYHKAVLKLLRRYGVNNERGDIFCYTVATLEWDSHESGFDFNSCGLRWLECEPSKRVIQMILKFTEMMTYVVRGWDEKENA